MNSLSKAQEEGSDILMIDTAGRLQNRTDLMEELAKIVRVLKKKKYQLLTIPCWCLMQQLARMR